MTGANANLEKAGAVRHPLVLAAACFLFGVAGARWMEWAAGGLVVGLIVVWLMWAAAEYLRRRRLAMGLLALGIVLSGAGVWTVNQDAVERTHIVRFVQAGAEVPVTFRGSVLVAPGTGDPRGGARWVARVEEILTDRGWLGASGDVVVASHGGKRLHVGERAEIYGWLSAIAPARNPGAMDARELLAADRIFAQVRVPRASGVVLLTVNDRSENWLAKARRLLRAKLLENIVLDDVPAAYTLTALLLGVRDPVINSVSQAFSNAGVAHLLAISGSHVVFFTALVWMVLRLVPARPRLREVAIAVIVGAYILATPCGPPIVRAAIALILVLLARLSGKPAQHLNTLAAAAILVVLVRPADITGAGFQLSFAATLGLILFAPRMYHLLLDRWIERQTLIAELSQSRGARRKLAVGKALGGLLVANMIGAGTAAPLVAFHFGQVNAWAVVAGFVALPFVMLAMIVAAAQLAASLVWGWLGGMLAPVTGGVGNLLIAVVTFLAALPGSAVAVRAPPAWIVLLMYAAILLWGMRRRLGLSRAAACNAVAASVVIAAAWYGVTMPRGGMTLTVLDAGPASSLLLRAPGGELWALGVGISRGGSAEALFSPALRIAGERQLAGMIVPALDVNHGSGAAELIAAAQPAAVVVSAAGWEHRHETLAGESVDRTTQAAGVAVQRVAAGDVIALGGGAQLEVLWPPRESLAGVGVRTSLILLCVQGERRVLVADPMELSVLTLVLRGRSIQCDGIVFTGAPRGALDRAMLDVIRPLQAHWLVWTGGPAAGSGRTTAQEFNTRDGALIITINGTESRVTRW